MRVLVVDDEPLARAALTELLSQRSDVEKFDVAEDAHEALATLRAHPYDVLLLDIHMPDLSGLQLIERLSKQDGPMPSVVFITAYQEHAVEAFEKRAVDYVLKPFDPKRVHEALDVAVRRSTQERAARLLEMLADLNLRSERTTRIAIKDKGRVVFVDSGELINRSVLVNVAFVDTIQPGAGSEYLLRTKTGRQYHVTRTYRKNLRGLAQFWIGTEGFDSD